MKRLMFLSCICSFAFQSALLVAYAGSDAARISSLSYRYMPGDESKRTYQAQFDNVDADEKAKKVIETVLRKVVQAPKAGVTFDKTSSKRLLEYWLEPPQGERFPNVRLYSLIVIGREPEAPVAEQWWEYELVTVGAPRRDEKLQSYLQGIFQTLIAHDSKVDEEKLKLRCFWKSAQPRLAAGTYTVRVFVARTID